MNKQNNIPSLRFPEFEGEWKMVKINDIGEVITGNTPPTENESFYNGNYLFVSPGDFSENRWIVKTKTSLTKLGFSKGRIVNPGSSLFVCIGSTIGKVAQNIFVCISNQQINSVVPNNNNNQDFVYTLLENHSKRIRNLAATQAVPIINKTTFSNYLLCIPQILEQENISLFFKSIDQKLQALKKKKSLLEEYKKGVMQQLFRQPEPSTEVYENEEDHAAIKSHPSQKSKKSQCRQLRFKRDDAGDFPDWEVKGGGDIFDSISNKNHNSDLPILAITQEYGAIPRDLIDYQISVTDKSVESYKVVEVGDFIISLRSFQGGIEYSNYKGICSPAYIILRSKIPIISLFYKEYLKTENYIKLLNKKLEGIRDGKMISYTYFSDIELPYPSLPEQTKIAKFLSALDEKINGVQAQIEKMEVWKKGLLQSMFV